ncbi:hypothetical protein T4E_9343, partial [Trichinella pseudospiralis]
LDFAVSSMQCRLAFAVTSNDRNLRLFFPLLYVSRIRQSPIQHVYVLLHNLQEACFDDLLRQLLCEYIFQNRQKTETNRKKNNNKNNINALAFNSFECSKIFKFKEKVANKLRENLNVQ